MSARQDALDTMLARLQTVTVANGYQTDLGENVLRGEKRTFGPDDPTQFLAMNILETETNHQQVNLAYRLPVDVEVIIQTGAEVGAGSPADPSDTIEAAIADIKTAMETDHDLGGACIHNGLERGEVSYLEREEGAEFVGARVQYILFLEEGWGSP